MSQAINECVAEVSWKTRALVRTQRFHTEPDLLNLWKAHILSYIEYRTPAWYHACETTIAPLDRCLSSFLRKIGVDDITALMKFNLAPLHTRRDMAMLAVIHRAALRKGPPAFHAFIRHSAQENRASDRLSIGRVSRILVEYRNCGNRLEIMRRSLFGLISVYNLLPESVIIYSTVQEFQRALQDNFTTVASSSLSIPFATLPQRMISSYCTGYCLVHCWYGLLLFTLERPTEWLGIFSIPQFHDG